MIMNTEQDYASNEEINETVGSVSLPESKPLSDAEWCFQFFDNEPVVFGWSAEGEEPGNLTFELKPIESEGMNFTQNGMTFRIFPREASEATKQLRAEQKQ
jgi:hypothetical protein